MRALPTALVVACIALPSLAHAASLRCGNKLVSEGASQTDAVAKCGQPVSTETKRERVTNKSREGRRDGSRRGDSSTEVSTSSSVEEWTYNFGPNRLLQVAIFRDGLLVDVRSGGYGY
ncbi:DUF2845 domain-containing protein [Corallococcus sp. AB004]|uniref:DUF2845 domain-containing protein n=1 Tax=Corallococcus TaxID=83461 RepID=UPI000EA2FC78|nr:MULTISPECIES: DUF2845 domain-containing protein [Corallococcus]RKI39528.1 DUF2845 domain-containing protein [Corallococcus sp. AB004]NPC72167.1 DUF2845 domain-containing protein [Corallococcus exiguus]NPD23500.1 DUF2845 domain-containing protein [Corallococcus exiguus]NRD47101.1 DUF2845 domain-containing protein [Corallococcus exiguus]RKI01565.1 DUF2845 domain-containing protein [Corallococcus sp. AB038B]